MYDAFDRRAGKSIAGTTTNFLYDGPNPVEELQAGAPSANLLTGLNIDEFFTRTDSSNSVSTLLTDALGSTIGLVGSSQSIATSYTYQPFGATAVGGAANGSSYEFTGRENDATGLYFGRTRYYSPTFHRFVAQDPIGFWGGDVDLYAYVGADPVDFRDPVGNGRVGGVVGGTIGAVVGGVAEGTEGAGVGTVIEPGGGTIAVAIAGTAVGAVTGARTGAKIGSAIEDAITGVSSGSSQAPLPGPANSIYEQLNPQGSVSSRTFYDENGNSFCRQDFEHAHGDIQGPHETNRQFYDNGMPMTPKITTPLSPGYSNVPTL